MAALKILIVDGDDSARAVHRHHLAAVGYVVHTVATASECIGLVRKLRPELIVMQRKLPDGDGWELARLLKGMASTAPIKVLAVIASASADEIERAFSTGCDGFLSTPFRPNVLVSQVQRLLGPKASTPPPIPAI